MRLEVRKSYNFEIISRKGRSIYKEQPNTTEKTARKFLASNIELFRPKRDGTLKERARLDRERLNVSISIKCNISKFILTYFFENIQGIFFGEKSDHSVRGQVKKVPQKYCETWCNKVRCHCPNKSSCLSVYATCKSSIPNLGTHQRFF